MLKYKKKGQSARGASTLISIIVMLIILYILFLPPEQRQQLLNPNETSPDGDTGITGAESVKVLLLEKPGKVEYVSEEEIIHNIPSLRLYSETSANLLKTEPSVYVKRGWFSGQIRNVSFSVEDVAHVKNVLLGFNVKKGSGILVIKLNGNEIFNSIVTKSNLAINLPENLLEKENSLEFSVSNVGWKFWATNEFLLEDLRITADIADISKQTAESVFIVTSTEKNNIERAFLKFYSDCDQGSVGRMYVYVNNHNVYSSVPDCGILRPIELSPTYLTSGENNIRFKVDIGTVLIDQISVKSELKEAANPIYYFELADELFKTTIKGTEAYCGEADGVCPEDCDEDQDKDCCFENSIYNFWCDLETNNIDDRCVGVVEDCSRCLTGYEDTDGDIAEACEGTCGDDNDDMCTVGCLRYYDKDCCYLNETNGSTNYYWCEDMPITGITSVCEAAVDAAECDDCSSDYRSERGYADCPAESAGESEFVLKDKYDVNLTIEFVDDFESKRATLVINGVETHIDQRARIYTKLIDPFVQNGNNAIELVPRTTLDIVKLEVRLIEKK